jgi:hypothetical protein
MNESRLGDRLIALFLFGCVAINPPLLAVFRTDLLVAGIPFLFLYIFGVWAVLIAALALIVERRRRRERAAGAPQGD